MLVKNVASTLSTYSVDVTSGEISLLLNAIAADEMNGDIVEPLDLELTSDGKYLYVLNAHNSASTPSDSVSPVAISYFTVSDNGVLTHVGVTAGLDIVSPGSIVDGPVGLAVI